MPSVSSGQNAFLQQLGARISEAREGARLSQDEAAKRIGIDKSTLSRYERGRVSPTAEVLMLMAVTMGVSADWLLTGEGVKERGEWGVDVAQSAMICLQVFDEELRRAGVQMAAEDRRAFAIGMYRTATDIGIIKHDELERAMRQFARTYAEFQRDRKGQPK